MQENNTWSSDSDDFLSQQSTTQSGNVMECWHICAQIEVQILAENILQKDDSLLLTYAQLERQVKIHN